MNDQASSETIQSEAEMRMQKALDSLQHQFNRIRTGRAHPGLLDSIQIDYYGAQTPLNQVAGVAVEDARTLMVTPWEKAMVPAVEKAIMKSDLGLNPSTAGAVIRVPLPVLTEETRKNYTRQARAEAENCRVAIRTARRDAMAALKALQKDKQLSEDDERRAAEQVQKLTDAQIERVEAALAVKEKDLLEI